MKKKIVVSAINIFEGGPLTILYECLFYLSKYKSNEYDIIAFVHDKSLISLNNINFIEIKKSRKNYFLRIFYEYIWFYFQSIKIKPHLWISLHDISPNVKAEKRVVYCHNPSPFFKISIDQMIKEPKLAFFNLFYSYLYKLNLDKNDFIIVQQKWIRKVFLEKYKAKSNILVSLPEVNIPHFNNVVQNNSSTINTPPIFFYPAYPRVFKNFEVICEAASILNKTNTNFQVYLTISGTENKYSKWIFNKYKNVSSVKFIGLQDKFHVLEIYKRSICLIFPSKLETWGLPITEAKSFNLPIILSNLPYSHETIGIYDKVVFFNPNNSVELATIMNNVILKKQIYTKTSQKIDDEFICKNWDITFNKILQ